MIAKQKANRDLRDYLHRRLDYLERCNTQVETEIWDQEMDLCRKIDDGFYSQNDPAIGEIIVHLEFVVGNTFRYTMVVGVCSFLEEAIKRITKRLVADYDAKIKAQRGGNWLSKHMRVLSHHAGLKIECLKGELDKFDDLIRLRNCIVHAWGNVAGARDPATVQTAVQRIETAEISKDGYLVLGDQVVPEAICTAENIADAIFPA